MSNSYLPRRAAKRDKNEKAIVEALTHVGASVEPLSGKGIPDLLVGFRSCTYLLEVKMPGEKLTSHQFNWHGWWNGQPVAVVYSASDALKAIGAVRE